MELILSRIHAYAKAQGSKKGFFRLGKQRSPAKTDKATSPVTRYLSPGRPLELFPVAASHSPEKLIDTADEPESDRGANDFLISIGIEQECNSDEEK